MVGDARNKAGFVVHERINLAINLAFQVVILAFLRETARLQIANFDHVTIAEYYLCAVDKIANRTRISIIAGRSCFRNQTANRFIRITKNRQI